MGLRGKFGELEPERGLLLVSVSQCAFPWNLLVPFSKTQVDMAVGKYRVTFGPSAE